MQVYALYGTSGTGKSSSALELAHRLGLDAIIDDGILVFQGRKVAGTSAKYEKTKIQAVKRAIFHYEDHAREVRHILQELPISKLLVLGTSKKMIGLIVEALDLPPVHEYIPIESIKPEKEIEAAKYVRETLGKHVIPIPRIEVEKDFFQKMIASAQQILSPKKEVIGEKTIVHPAFTGGRIQIYEQVLKKLVQHCCYRFAEIAKVNKVSYSFEDLPRLSIGVTLQTEFATSLKAIAVDLQHAVYDEVNTLLNISPASIDIQIQGLQLNHQRNE